MEIAVEKLVAISFAVIGLSHLFQPRAWEEFFIGFRQKGEAGSIQLGLLYLPVALLIVTLHNVWHGLPMIVTLIGWSQLLKSVVYLLWPRHGLRMLAFVSVERTWQFIVGGIFSIAVSGVIFWSLWHASAVTR